MLMGTRVAGLAPRAYGAVAAAPIGPPGAQPAQPAHPRAGVGGAMDPEMLKKIQASAAAVAARLNQVWPCKSTCGVRSDRSRAPC